MRASLKVSEGIVRMLSNFSNTKLKQVLDGNSTYKPEDIVRKAEDMRRNAMMVGNDLQEQKLQDLVEEVKLYHNQKLAEA